MAELATVVDPYEVVQSMVRRLAEHGVAGPFTGEQMGQAAVCVAAMLVALGVEPRVAGEATHPDVFRGRALAELVADWRAAPTGPDGGGSGGR